MGRSVRSRVVVALACALAGLAAWPASANAAVDVYHTTLLSNNGTTASAGAPLALSPDGSLLATYQGGDEVGIYATASDTLVRTVTTATSAVDALAFWSDNVLVLGEDTVVEFVTAGGGLGGTGLASSKTVASGTQVAEVAPVSATRAYVLENGGAIGTADVSSSTTIAAGVPTLNLPDSYAAIAVAPAATSTLYALTAATTAAVEAIPTTGASANSVVRTVPLNASVDSSNGAEPLTISPSGSELFVGEDTQLAGISTTSWTQTTTTLPTADEGYPVSSAPSGEQTSCDAVDVSLDGGTVYCSGPDASTAAPNLYWFSASTLAYEGAYDLATTAPAGSAVAGGAQVIAATNSRVYAALASGSTASIPVSTVLADAAVPQGSPPGTPTNVAVTTGNTQLTVGWSAPSDDGGQPITGYTVTAQPLDSSGAASGAASTCSPGGTGTSCTITGLATWTSYAVTVLATNVLGSSNPTTAVDVTTSVPTAPRSVGVASGAVTTVGNVSTVTAGVSWTAPASSGGSAIAGYYVCADPSGASPATCGAATSTEAVGTAVSKAATGGTSLGNAVAELLGPGARSVSLPSLTLGKTYLVTVTAYNACTVGGAEPACGEGTVPAPGGYALGQTSAPVTIVAGAPSAPTGLIATEANQTITLTWGAPTDVGSPAFTSYSAVLEPGDIKCPATLSATTLTCTYTGLTNGTSYTASVAAVNTTATGPAATLTNLVPATTPGAPTVKAVSFAGNTATVSWTAPTSDGGSAITAYTATARASGVSATCISTTLTCSISGLTAGLTYSLTVVATNKIGSGPVSAAYAATLTGAPSVVTGVTASLVGRTLHLRWTPPANPGAPSIVAYDVVATSAQDDAQCATSGATVCTLTKLKVGQTYTVAITATNSGGYQSPASAAVTVRPVATPGHPTVARKKAAGHHQVNVTVRWKPVAGATGYTIRRTGGTVPRLTRRVGAKARTLLFRNLPRGHYEFVVAALCPHGRGVFSTELSVRVK